jgi:hypothetical protein
VATVPRRGPEHSAVVAWPGGWGPLEEPPSSHIEGTFNGVTVCDTTLSVYTSRAEINNRVRFRQATPGSFDNLNLKLPMAIMPLQSIIAGGLRRVLARTS